MREDQTLQNNGHKSQEQECAEGGERSRPGFRELEILDAVLRFGKTTAAAASLGISQPAISRALASLETRIGRTLFHRDGGRLIPTNEAHAFNKEAGGVLNAYRKLLAWPDGSTVEGQLRICVTATLAHHYLARLLPEFIAAQPAIRVQIEIRNSTDVIDDVADGRAQLGLIDQRPTHSGIVAEPLRQSIAHVFLPIGHPLAGKIAITASDIHRERFIGLPRRIMIRAQLEAALARAGSVPEIVAECATSALAAELVIGGCGITVLNPFPLAAYYGNRLVLRPFVPDIPCETVALTSRGVSRSLAAGAFIAFLQAAGQNDTGKGNRLTKILQSGKSPVTGSDLI